MDKFYVVCVPETWSHTPDSTQERCINCDCVVWVSKSGMKLAQDSGADFLCLHCSELQENVVVMPPTVEQLAAVQRNAERN